MTEEEKITKPAEEPEVVEEEVKIEVEKDVLEVPKEEVIEEKMISKEIEGWKPKTSLGKKVHSGEINDIDTILDNGMRILEPQITDMLMPGLQKELLLIGQSKGKFGGGSRRIFKQTQKKTPWETILALLVLLLLVMKMVMLAEEEENPRTLFLLVKKPPETQN
jgi:hypothetical protein